MRLGARMPFAQAVEEIKHFTQSDISRVTVERLTEAAGAAYVRYQNQELEQLEKTLVPAPAGAGQQFLRVDGAMIPLVGGEWAEVKTLVIGEVKPPLLVAGECVSQTAALSYFSRMVDAETFQRLALVETQRRGLETAKAVAAITDGAEWIQGFIDFHRPDALRILDFAHASQRFTLVGQGCLGGATPQATTWLTTQLHALKHSGPTEVLTTLRTLIATQPDPAALSPHLAYLEKRSAHRQYPTFQQAGWPIGSGAVESANKLVVEARLKGAGMHWARPNVDAMLALRNILCSDRWHQAWPQITATLRQQTRLRRTALHQKHRALSTPLPTHTPKTTLSAPRPTQTPQPLIPLPNPLPSLPTAISISSPKPRRPAPNHPWRRYQLPPPPQFAKS